MDIIKQCLRCGAILTSKKSVERGYGPVCWSKTQAEQAADELEDTGC